MLAFLDVKSSLPKIYFSDSTFKLMQDYYPEFSNLMSKSKEWGNDIEQRALNNTDIVILPSHWAAKSAISDYKCIKEKIHIIPCGVNFEELPKRKDILR